MPSVFITFEIKAIPFKGLGKLDQVGQLGMVLGIQAKIKNLKIFLKMPV